MKIFERAHHHLNLEIENSPKVGALFLINAAAWFLLGGMGVSEFSSPWIVLTLVPNVLICIAEKAGKLRWFAGMSLPSLLVAIASVVFLWLLKAEMQPPAAIAYAAVAGLIAALIFLGYRMWTFDPAAQNRERHL
ncbi:hypothetical protein [Aurantiacibacter sp. MUD61]|uniref:hypothetical protein n=1 Tax=Aurantiacibacter sp. MUD61 TaxID=3009083 RepID=UPI0022F11E30|nr:hypothetical protein [Aurantiacibacter sp. MUD61]